MLPQAAKNKRSCYRAIIRFNDRRPHLNGVWHGFCVYFSYAVGACHQNHVCNCAAVYPVEDLSVLTPSLNMVSPSQQVANDAQLMAVLSAAVHRYRQDGS